MKKINVLGLMLAGMLLISMPAAMSAQTETNRDADGNIVKGPYLTNKFGDNWFIEFGAGAGMYLGGHNQDFGGRIAPTFSLSFGKWFTPSIGARFAAGFSPKFKEYPFRDKWDFYCYNVHADFLWDMITTFGGYKENRIYHLIPYLGGGYAQAGGSNLPYGPGRSFTVNGGIINKFVLGKVVDLNFVISGALATSQLDNMNNVGPDVLPYSSDKGGPVIDAPISAMVGLSFNINAKKFQRASNYAAEKVNMAVAKAIADKDKEMQAEKDRLNKEIEDLKAKLAAKPEPAPVVVNNVGSFPPEVIVFFDLNKSTLNPKEDSHFQTFVHFVKQSIAFGKKVTLIGSADKATGNAKVNMRLAKERAELVKSMLVNQYGISAGELDTVAEGDSNNRFEENDMNRCVWVKFVNE